MLPPYSYYCLLLQTADPIIEKVSGALVSIVVVQVVLGVIFMIGFVAIARRSIDKEIPAKLQSIDKHIEELGRELIQMRRDVDRHSYKIEALEKWQERREDDPPPSLDDTRSRQRPPNSRR